MPSSLVPELLCTDLAATHDFYVGVLHFRVRHERPEEAFVYLSRDGIEIMFEQVDGPGRRWITGPLERPFGRGINFQLEIENVAGLFAEVVRARPASIYLPLEEKAYQAGDESSVSRQFVVQDPDGYLLRFAEFLTQ